MAKGTKGMRLTCPSCGAQYEVPPEAIPPAGRDVQCSNCQHTWFERGAAPPPRLVDPDPLDSLPRVEGGEEEEDDLADLRAAPPPEAPPRPRVAPEVSRILREEAQRESEARAAEEAARHAVPDLAPRPAPSPPRRLHARGTEAPAETPAAAPTAAPTAPPARTPRPARTSERELDLDQINATLRSQPERAPAARAPARPEPRASSGFGRGFLGALLLLALLAALYAFRPQITQAVPAAATVLDPYAGAVDAGRDWLDAQVGRLLGAG